MSATAHQKPAKLTGWAAAAARAAPPKVREQKESRDKITSPKHKSSSPQAPTQRRIATAGATALNSTAAAATNHGQPKKTKPPAKSNFNTSQVLRYLQDTYASQTASPSTTIYARPKVASKDPHWGTAGSSRHRSKKYAYLNEVARAIRQ
ncbi:LAMI_0A02960g1_1 [Lachancea mirantina]|uniref:LAMI_0A02960g1_1 n=1 Tax=Lachancea mirantina TaxID=1230905 RepID=A0A1G4INE9_9SACH|nr:LAMI_0A02960g1_1 [Lachancea mirantina]